MMGKEGRSELATACSRHIRKKDITEGREKKKRCKSGPIGLKCKNLLSRKRNEPAKRGGNGREEGGEALLE